jgi:hypothetical protein
MAYDSNFHVAYKEYLHESRVRKVHDRILHMVYQSDDSFKRVLDLGCAQNHEYYHNLLPDAYVGIDIHPGVITLSTDETQSSPIAIVKHGDVKDIPLVKKLILDYNLMACVSLFGIENNNSCRDNYTFYRSLFKKTSINTILTAGFYYGTFPDKEAIIEIMGLKAYQAIHPIEKTLILSGGLFDETRIEVMCPSDFFGEDVVEVWKILTRK